MQAGHSERERGGLPAQALCGFGGCDGVQLFAGLETNGFARGDVDLGTGAGIAANPGFAGTDAENAESAQFDALACGQSLLEALEDRIHRRLSLGARQSGALDDVMDDVLFNQRGNLAGANGMNVLRLLALMLQVSRELGNRRIEPV
jgi:hypothetical protein